MVSFVSEFPSGADNPKCVFLTGYEGSSSELPPHTEISLANFLDGTSSTRELYVNWLGSENIRSHARHWWAYASTAKNMLSTPLGNQVLECLAMIRIIKSGLTETLHVFGAGSGQIECLRTWASTHRPEVKIRDNRRGRSRYFAMPILRLLRQLLYLLYWYPALRGALKSPAKICLLTYVDAAFRTGTDAFFGDLASFLEQRSGEGSVTHLAYIQAPYRAVLPKLRTSSGTYAYQPLFSELVLSDLFQGFFESVKAIQWAKSAVFNPIGGELDVTPVVRMSFLWDVAKGGYFQNQLVYRAVLRLATRTKPDRFIYPYENKSLEKMALLGLQNMRPECRTIGYQHTSITPRHSTLLFAQGECNITPLPTTILTAGLVTHRWLTTLGNYPDGMLRPACALRQKSAPANRIARSRLHADKTRVLFALSSSLRELARSVEICKDLSAASPTLAFGIRPHPEFPIRRLAQCHRDWVNQAHADLGGTLLSDNLDWCDLLVYVSSTVAVEALMRGIPVINLDIGDYLDPDPVVESVRFRFKARNASEVAQTIERLSQLPEEDFLKHSNDAITYAHSYLVPPNDEKLAEFIQ